MKMPLAEYIENWEDILGIKSTKRVFVAATRRNTGKTTVCLGLIASLAKYFKNVGFIKPVGQRYVVEDGFKVDEDSVLMERIFKFKTAIQDMSPVAVERGFTEKFLDGKVSFDSSARIRESFERIAKGRELVVIEGTGHAGVGSVFDLSNATVARMLNSRVILVSKGGIGDPIDEIILNKSLFDLKGVKLTGVIVNKVLPEKYDKINKYIRTGLSRLGIPVLGVIPYAEVLEMPTMLDIKEDLEMHVLCGTKNLGRQIKKVLVGAMEEKEAARYIEEDCLVITPGNRSDLLTLMAKIHTGQFRSQKRVAGLILTGGLVPKRRIYNMLKKTNIPTLLSRFDTYEIASRIHDLTVKIKSRDESKVKLAIDMVEKYIDLGRIISSLN